MTLTNPTDQELNAAFATEVCGWVHLHAEHQFPGPKVEIDAWARPDGLFVDAMPRFTSDMSALLPWMNKLSFQLKTLWSEDGFPQGFSVHIYTGAEGGTGDAEDKSLERACLLALLRAHGVEVNFI